MSAENFLNSIKYHAAQMDYNLSHPQMGIVVSYNPANATARVNLQPENTLTDWLPVKFPMTGAGIGVVCPPVQGQQVVVAFEGGSRNDGVVLGACYSDQSLPAVGFNGMPVQSGEIALISGTGQTFIHMLSNGNIQAQSGGTTIAMMPSGIAIVADLSIDGTLTVSGNITASGDIVAGTVSLKNHTHQDDGAGPPNT